jgi:hypothetical protein
MFLWIPLQEPSLPLSGEAAPFDLPADECRCGGVCSLCAAAGLPPTRGSGGARP